MLRAELSSRLENLTPGPLSASGEGAQGTAQRRAGVRFETREPGVAAGLLVR